MYTTQTLITIAKREHNTKRNFLLVNPLQGKHLPVSPSATFSLIEELATKVFSHYGKRPMLLIGFAETATAIGAMLASFAPVETLYLHTTREPLPGNDYLFFHEEHSHATDQKLITNTMEHYLQQNMLVLFIEDEITTGNTINNCIRQFESTYPHHNLEYGIASILNGMSVEKRKEFSARNILFHSLSAVPSYDYDCILASVVAEPSITVDVSSSPISSPFFIDGFQDARLGVMTTDYVTACHSFCKKVEQALDFSTFTGKRICILGTEECMYPGLYLGRYLEENIDSVDVFFHATTRSPIVPSKTEGYPIQARYPLPSFYDQQRTTYLYNLDHYDEVLLVTDSTINTSALHHLTALFDTLHTTTLTPIYWR